MSGTVGTVTLYHNPRCSKSRQTLALLEDRGIEPQIIKYLETPPDEATISGLLDKLGIRAIELVRRKEPPFAELGLASSEEDDPALIAAMARHPILIERPIVVAGEEARIGRPPENILDIL
ncbi:MAG: arsenate reductase (glutaredoxin) [Planctomycetota bacterium]|nr:arsenate reductase (glutaredoxin) [Planctomycetota bacterium]MEE3052294.1 arsenate reductase (glutaredoxin) [Planctomycetota bacterium]